MTVPQQPIRWLKASKSQDEGACLELALPGLLRDSKNPNGPQLKFDLGSFVRAVQNDQIAPR